MFRDLQADITQYAIYIAMWLRVCEVYVRTISFRHIDIDLMVGLVLLSGNLTRIRRTQSHHQRRFFHNKRAPRLSFPLSSRAFQCCHHQAQSCELKPSATGLSRSRSRFFSGDHEELAEEASVDCVDVLADSGNRDLMVFDAGLDWLDGC